jgi:peptidoglycan/LPS O-acetylase OafA/YrhL
MIGYPLMSLGAAAIFLSVLGAAQDGISFLKNPLLVYLGKISYGLYAFHLLALQLSTNLFAQYHHSFSQTLSWLFALGMTFFLAVVSYRWLESPFLRWKQRSFTHVPSGAPS